MIEIISGIMYSTVICVNAAMVMNNPINLISTSIDLYTEYRDHYQIFNTLQFFASLKILNRKS